MNYKKIKNKPLITEQISLIEELLIEIFPLLENQSNQAIIIQARLVWNKIEEDLDCLNNRLIEVQEAENKFREFTRLFNEGKSEDFWDLIKDFKPLVKKRDPLHYIQLNYVDKVTSFYEKLYVCISHVSLITHTLAPKKYKDQLGGQRVGKHSNTKFVESVGSLFKSKLRFQTICSEILNVVNFRGQMTHSINSSDFTWVTMDYEKSKGEIGTYLLFLKTQVRNIGDNLLPDKKQTITSRYQYINPYKSNYMPPFQVDDWYVTPNCVESFETLIEFIRQLFKYISN